MREVATPAGLSPAAVSRVLEPGLTVVAEHPAELGRVAAQLLFARLGGDREPTRRLVVPTTLIERELRELAP